MLRFTPLTNDDAGLPNHASAAAASRGVTSRPPACFTHQSIILSEGVLRKPGSRGESMGHGQTLLTRTPFAAAGYESFIVQTCTTSLLKEDDSKASSRPANHPSPPSH